MRVLGCLLLLKVLYPDYAGDIDLPAETRAFYEKFLRIDLTDRDLSDILETAGIAL